MLNKDNNILPETAANFLTSYDDDNSKHVSKNSTRVI